MPVSDNCYHIKSAQQLIVLYRTGERRSLISTISRSAFSPVLPCHSRRSLGLIKGLVESSRWPDQTTIQVWLNPNSRGYLEERVRFMAGTLTMRGTISILSKLVGKRRINEICVKLVASRQTSETTGG